MQGSRQTSLADITVASPHEPGYWMALNPHAEAIRGFLISVDANRIGKGLVRYDREKFQLLPRSEYFNSHKMQWILTIGETTATFDATQEAFVHLIEKIEFLGRHISKFDPQKAEDCPKESQDFLVDLIETQRIIEGIARIGLAQLRANYMLADKNDNATTLGGMGEKAFTLLSEMERNLTVKLVGHIPEFSERVALEKFFVGAKEILSSRAAYCANLRGVSWNPINGTMIPEGLIENCFRDVYRAKPTKQALRVAANYIKFPLKALSIPAQGGAVQWKPLRPVLGERGICFEQGVVGTCERDGAGSANLCNLYYRADREDASLIVSSGAINSPIKAKQLAAAIVHMQSEIPPVNGRWMIHSLYSYWGESELINGVHANLSLIETSLRERLERVDVSFLHVNTCFNAASYYVPYENDRSLRNINLESLGLLINYVLADASDLLKDLEIPYFPKEGGGYFSEQCRLVLDLAREIMSIKSRINGDKTNKAAEPPGQLDDRFIFIEGDEVPKVAIDGDLQNRELGSEHSRELSDELDAIVKELPKGIRDLKVLLTQKQSQLFETLHRITNHVREVRDGLEVLNREQIHLPVRQALLMFKVLHQVLSLQLRKAESPSLSRCGEIECFLLLYRLLKINTVIICWSGLDRSGAVRALADSQSQLVRTYYQQNLDRLGEATELDRAAAWNEAGHKMFDLILHLDQNRDKLLVMAAAIQPQLQVSRVEQWEDTNASPTIRQELIQRITAEHPDLAGERLIDTLYYLELVVSHLLGTETEKTYLSTGAPGLKYLQNAKWLKRFFANFHPLDRWPPFLSAQGKTIRLLDISQGFRSNTLKITPIATALILRLSKWRGN